MKWTISSNSAAEFEPCIVSEVTGNYQLRLADISFFVSHFEYISKILATQKKFPAFNGYSLAHANAQLVFIWLRVMVSAPKVHYP